jgi:hypothetical protein
MNIKQSMLLFPAFQYYDVLQRRVILLSSHHVSDTLYQTVYFL